MLLRTKAYGFEDTKKKMDKHLDLCKKLKLRQEWNNDYWNILGILILIDFDPVCSFDCIKGM